MIVVLGKGRRPRTIPFGVGTAKALDRWLLEREGHANAHSNMLWLGTKGRTFGDHGIRIMLNRRAEQFIGRRYVLDTAIVNGQGKARVGDSHWLVAGPDLPVGETVEVVAVEGTTLKVRKAG